MLYSLLDADAEDSSILNTRWLQSTNETIPEDEVVVELNDSTVLRNTFYVYGWGLVMNVLFFCWLRLRFPRPFTIRKWTTNPDLWVCLQPSVNLSLVEAHTSHHSHSVLIIMLNSEPNRRKSVWFLFLDLENLH